MSVSDISLLINVYIILVKAILMYIYIVTS